jgi:hypothetical protein
LGILGIENRKLKIEKKFSLSKPATTTKKKLNFFIFYFFIVRADAPPHPRGRTLASAQTPMSARTHCRVRTDALCFTLGNFKTDTTVRPSHGRPHGHRPIVRPSENVRMTTLGQLRGDELQNLVHHWVEDRLEVLLRDLHD